MKLHDVEISEKDNLIDGREEFLERIMSINEEIHSNPTEERLQEIMKKNEGRERERERERGCICNGCVSILITN